MKTVQVEYVGLKDQETDHLYGTDITWIGKGDVRAVPITAWAGMSKHPDVWRLVKDDELKQATTASKIEGLSSVNASKIEAVIEPDASKTEGQAEGDGNDGDGLNDLDLQQLRDLCTARGIDFHPNSKEASLIAKLRA